MKFFVLSLLSAFTLSFVFPLSLFPLEAAKNKKEDSQKEWPIEPEIEPEDSMRDIHNPRDRLVDNASSSSSGDDNHAGFEGGCFGALDH